MREGEDFEVVWSGGDPLLPPRDSKPQIPMPVVREKRMYNRKVKGVEQDGQTNRGKTWGNPEDARVVNPIEEG